MKKFKENNHKLSLTMKTHLINDLKEFGVWENDYERFFQKRAEAVSQELSKRIITQEIDNKKQVCLIDDYEEESTMAE